MPAALEYDATRDPEAAECCLIVEVAESSLEWDRTTKRDVYAAAGIPVYWILDLAGRQLELYSDPARGTYPAPRIIAETESVDVVLDGQVVGRIAVADLLPPESHP